MSVVKKERPICMRFMTGHDWLRQRTPVAAARLALLAADRKLAEVHSLAQEAGRILAAQEAGRILAAPEAGKRQGTVLVRHRAAAVHSQGMPYSHTCYSQQEAVG